MKANPYGASCGTSMVVAPSVVRATTGKIGTRGARLSDTKSGKAPKRVRTKEELESMVKHPSLKSKRAEALTHDDECQCYCTIIKREDSEMVALLAEIEERAEAHRAMLHERVMENLRAEGNKDAVHKAELAERLRLMGDSDS